MQIDGQSYTAIATGGDVFLGGIDWDRRIADLVAERFQAEHDVDPREDAIAMQTLLREAEDGKVALRRRDGVEIGSLPLERFLSLLGEEVDRRVLEPSISPDD